MTDNEIASKLGKRMREQRKKVGLTQQKLSEIVDLSPNYYSDIERGKSFPSFEKFVAIANALHCSADDLFCDSIKASEHIIAAEISQKIEALSAEEKAKFSAILDAFLRP